MTYRHDLNSIKGSMSYSVYCGWNSNCNFFSLQKLYILILIYCYDRQTIGLKLQWFGFKCFVLYILGIRKPVVYTGARELISCVSSVLSCVWNQILFNMYICSAPVQISVYSVCSNAFLPYVVVPRLNKFFVICNL